MTNENRRLKVFLCHASPDKTQVSGLYRRLQAEGWIDPWLDAAKLLPGQHWSTVIKQALAEADSVVIFISHNSVDREGFSQRELNLAWDSSLEKPRSAIYLIPLRLEDCEVPFELRERQWADYFGEKQDETYLALLKALRLRLDQKLRSEARERIVREQAEKEAAEKAAREQAEREALETEIRQKLEREAAEKAAREQETRERLEREAAEKALLQAAARPSVVQPVPENPKNDPLPSTLPKANLISHADYKKRKPLSLALGMLGGIGLIGLVGLLCSVLLVNAWNWFDQFTSPALPTQPALSTDLPAEFTDEKGVKMALIPAGVYTVGNESGLEDEKPVHPVTLEAFYLDVYEVTNARYAACVQAGTCTPPADTEHYANPQYANHPVTYVSWNQAQTYCVWRGPAGNLGEARLPTEAEWEAAARGLETSGETRIYPWGTELDATYANYGGLVGDTTEVGHYIKGRSPFGLYDLAGNVWEWTADWYQPYPGNQVRRTEYGEKFRVVRGGSWDDKANSLFIFSRFWQIPDDKLYVIGFRCAR